LATKAKQVFTFSSKLSPGASPIERKLFHEQLTPSLLNLMYESKAMKLKTSIL
jgi:hypothetical protein